MRFLRSDCTPLTRTSKLFITHVSPMLCFLMFVYSPVGFACYFVIIAVIEEKKGFFFRWFSGAFLFLLSMLLFLFSGG